MSTTATETTPGAENMVLYRNEKEIEKEIEKAREDLPLFQPLVTALLKNTFAVKPTIIDLRMWIMAGDIAPILQREALLLTPAINNMPTPEPMKLALVDAEVCFTNYKAILAAYAKLPKQIYVRQAINNYVLLDNNLLSIPAHTIEEIENKHTVYADTPEQKELFDKASQMLEQAREFYISTGVNLFSNIYPIASANDITGANWLVDPFMFKKQLSPQAKEFIEHKKASR